MNSFVTVHLSRRSSFYRSHLLSVPVFLSTYRDFPAVRWLSGHCFTTGYSPATEKKHRRRLLKRSMLRARFITEPRGAAVAEALVNLSSGKHSRGLSLRVTMEARRS